MSERRVSHLKRQVFCLVFFFLFSDSTLSANRPVASPFIWESSCFWTKPSLLMQRDLSALLCVHPLLCEIWHDRSYRGFKPQFVTLLTEQKMRDFVFRLSVEYLCNSLAPLVEFAEFIHDLNNMYSMTSVSFLLFFKLRQYQNASDNALSVFQGTSHYRENVFNALMKPFSCLSFKSQGREVGIPEMITL